MTELRGRLPSLIATLILSVLALGCETKGLSTFLSEDSSGLTPSPTPTPSTSHFKIGINLAGLEGGALPGTVDYDYAAPTVAEMDYYKTRGLMTLRLPVRWERLQPTLSGALDEDYLDLIREQAARAEARGMKILLDIHNSGGRTEGAIGSANVSVADFTDLWDRLAREFKGHAGMGGYDLMNEPHAISNPADWTAAAQAAISKIRETDMDMPIYVEGSTWASSWNWESMNPDLHTLADPADKLIFSAHCYLDRDNSGSHFDWLAEVAAGSSSPVGAPMDTNIGVVRLTSFVNWLKKHGFRGHIGEIGAGHNHPDWIETLDKTLAFAKRNDLEVHYWAGGPLWGDYAYSVESGITGLQAKQMAVLTKYSGGTPEPTVYALTGPTRGTAGVPSDSFTIDYRGQLKTAVTITPTDGGKGGSFTPTSVTLSPGLNATATFTYTPNGQQTVSIGASNSAGWTNPTAIGFSSETDLFQQTTVEPVNILAFRKIYAPYTGPLIRLLRDSDNAEQDFYPAASGALDRAAIQTWAGGPHSTLRLIRWYDQSPRKNDMQTVFSNNAGGGTTPRDYPIFKLDDGDGHPVLLFDGHRADLPSPLQNVTGHTFLTHVQHRAGSHMLSAQFESFTNFMDGSDWVIQDGGSGTPEALSLGVVADQWHSYGGSWMASGNTNGWKSFKDGVAVATRTSISAKFTLEYGNNEFNIGYFRWWGPTRWYGKMREIIIFRGAIADTLLTDFQQDTLDHYANPLPALAAYTDPVIVPVTGPTMGTQFKGVNLSGAEYGTLYGVPFWDYTYPITAEIDYFHTKGFRLIRLPFNMNRLQPVRSSPFNAGDLAQIDRIVQYARSKGMWVVLDPHNYGQMTDEDGVDVAIGTAGMPTAHFVDFWTRLASIYRNQPNVIFGLMNEPHLQTPAEWRAVAEAAVNAIRATGSTHKIFVQGTHYSGAHSWISGGNAAAWAGFTDINFAYEVHQYFDHDSSGTNDICVASSSESIDSFTAWAKTEGVEAFLGEFGWSTDASCPAEADALMDTMSANADVWMGWSYWTAGPWMGSYRYSVEPLDIGLATQQDRPQLQILLDHL